MSKWILFSAIPLAIVSIYLAAQQVAEGSFPYSLTNVFLLAAAILEQPAPKRALARRGAMLSYSCLGVALAIVIAQLTGLT